MHIKAGFAPLYRS